jgi:hypothetical protein
MKELRDLLEMLAFAAQIISFPIAAVSIFLSRTEAKASRDLQVALTLSDSFRKYWESGWGETLEAITDFQKLNPGTDLSKEHEKQLRFMLNWIDWLGTFIKTKCFSKPDIVFGSISMRLCQIINAGRVTLERDMEKFGVDYWNGVLTVSKLLKIEWTDTHCSKIK